MIQKKEIEIDRLLGQLSSARREGDVARKESNDLQAKLASLGQELSALKGDRDRILQAKTTLESELDELRNIITAKTSEESKRNEVERSKEQELASLRGQATRLQQELAEVRRVSAETQNKLKVDVDTGKRDHEALVKTHAELLSKVKSAEARLAEAELGLVAAEKAKRASESELQSVRSRQLDLDGQLAQAVKAKEVGVTSAKVRGTAH